MSNEIESGDVLDTIEGFVCKRAAKHAGIGPEEITRETSFDSIGMDSLDVIDFCYDIECHFDIDVPDDCLAELETVGQMVDKVIERVAMGAA